MKLLLSCVNSLVSLVGYDTDLQQSFWYLPANILRVCGLSYSRGGLVAASDNACYEIGPDVIRQVNLPGPHSNFAHSVHAENGVVGVADTGNSRLLFWREKETAMEIYNPLEGWDAPPEDAIHLNDFVPWKSGYLATCFSFKPFQGLKKHKALWNIGGHGLILHLFKYKGETVTKVVASGLSCPHSLVVRDDKVYCCSSTEGDLIEFKEDGRGRLAETNRWKVADKHFLRGALPHETGWFLGGSTIRHENTSDMSLFHLDPATDRVAKMFVGGAGEIYDVLPWKDEIVRPLARALNNLPVTVTDDNQYPEKIALPEF